MDLECFSISICLMLLITLLLMICTGPQERYRISRSDRKRKVKKTNPEISEITNETQNLNMKHLEEMERLKNLADAQRRKDVHLEKQNLMEHQRLADGQDQLFSIFKNTFGKIKQVDINEAVYSAYIMQCINQGKPIDSFVTEKILPQKEGTLPSIL